MMSDDRTRALSEHGEAVGRCLQVAATNSALLERPTAHTDLRVMTYAMRRTVVTALDAAAKHVDVFADRTPWNVGERPTPEQEAAREEIVRAIGRELVALSQRAASQTIGLVEFEDIRGRLMDVGFALMPHHALDVASAIMGQERP